MEDHLPVDPGLLPRFQAWKAGVHSPTGEPARDVRLWTYLFSEASPDLAVAFAALFWPAFFEVDDYILLAEHYRTDNLAGWQHWRRRTGAERWQVEAVVKETHLYDVFLEEAALPVLEHLAATLQRCWRAALREADPDREFAVSYATEPETYGPTATFWQGGRPSP